MKPRGWFRRNLWGLILVVPLSLGLFGTNVTEIYQRNYTIQAKQPAPVDGTGRAVLGDYAARVIELAPVENEIEIDRLLGTSSSPLPASVKVWRLMLAVEGTKESFVGQCTTYLQDAAGRQYRMNPTELPRASFGFHSCGPDDEDQPVPYTSTSFFLLPAESRPAAVVITWPNRLPGFIRFPVLP